MIGLMGKFGAHVGQQSALAEYLLQAAELMRQAPGCKLYVVQTSGEHDVWVTEVWETKHDHDNSLKIEGVPELIAQARPLIAKMSEPIWTEVWGGKGL